MKEQLLRVGRSMYDFIKSPLGLAVTGSLAGSASTYLFERTKIARDLMLAQADKQQLEERTVHLQKENLELSRQNRELLLINTNYTRKSDELRDELRHAAADIVILKDQVNGCNRNLDKFSSLMENSWFFCRKDAYNNSTTMTTLESHYQKK